MIAKRHTILLSLTAGLLLCVSCRKETAVQLQVDENAPLEFYGGMSSASTKGATPVDGTSIRTSHMGLFAYWEGTDEYFDGGDPGRLYLDNREVVYSSTESGIDYWRCSPAAWWPLGNNLTFFAYAPYMPTMEPVLDFPLRTLNTMPRGTFIQKTAVNEQVDLCLSAPVYDVPKTAGSVPLQLSHALTKVLFYFNLSSEKYEGETRKFMVKSLVLNDVVGKNSFTFGGSKGYYWDNLPRSATELRNASYSLSIPDGTLSYVPLPYAEDVASETGLNQFVCVNGLSDGLLFMLPQPMTGGSSVTVVVSAYAYDSGTDTWIEDPTDEMDPVTIYLPEYNVWDPGKTVAYSASLNADLPITFNVTLLPWGTNQTDAGQFDASEL